MCFIDCIGHYSYTLITANCLEGVTAFSPILLQELHQTSLLKVYSPFDQGFLWYFWSFVSSVFDKCDSQVSRDGSPSNMGIFTSVPQDLKEIYPNLVSNLTTICRQGFHMPKPDECLTKLIYHEYYAPILHLQFPNSHLSLPKKHIHPQIDALLRTIITTHLPCLKNTLVVQHYTSLADYFLIELSSIRRYVLETTFVC